MTFSTTTFDVTRETPNPINPIAGQSVLQWLRDRLGSAYEATVPQPEDWGWYIYVKGVGASYLIGASADARDENRCAEWTIQIHKQRSLWEKLRGTNQLTSDDPLTALIETILHNEAGISDLEVDR